MNIIIKNKKEIEIIREGGKILAEILDKVSTRIKAGVSAYDLDQYAFKLIKEKGGKPAFLNYKPEGASKAYPASLCVSINDEIVHGIPAKNKILKDGDIVSIDLGLKYKGLFTDHAMTVGVGEISAKNKKLIEKTKEALDIGIWAAVGGKTVGDIGNAIETFVSKNYGLVRDLAGHGVGKEVHEDPYVPNFGKAGSGPKLIPGMIIAIEPMLCVGRGDIISMSDGYTIKTKDGSTSAHFEHTILITEGGAEILTMI
jgi:methionyl aminopeptidase